MSKKLFLKILISLSLIPLFITNTKAKDLSYKDNKYYSFMAAAYFSVDPDSNFSKRYIPKSIKLKQISVGIKQGDKLLGTGLLLEKKEDVYTIVTSREILENSNQDNLIEIVFFDGNTYRTSEIEYISNLDLASIKIRSDKNYELGKFKKLPFNIAQGDLLNKAIFNIGFKGFSKDNKPIYLLNSGNLIANTDYSIQRGYQLIYSNRSQKNFIGGPIFDRQGFIVGMHSKYNKNRRIQVYGDEFVGVSQGIPIDLIFDSINKTSDTKNKNQKYITNGYDDELEYYVRKMDQKCKTGPSGGIMSTACNRTVQYILNNKKCSSESIKEIIRNYGYDDYKVESEIRSCLFAGSIVYSDKEIAESVFSDYLYKKSLHNKINNIYGRTETSKVKPSKMIKKSAQCEKKIVEYYGNANYLMESIQAEKDYDNCKLNRDKIYKAELEANTIKKYIPGIDDSNTLPEKIVKSCIKLDNYRYEEGYDVPDFHDCLSYTSDSYWVGKLADPVLGRMKGTIKDFWLNDNSKDNLCRTFPYDRDKKACQFLLNR